MGMACLREEDRCVCQEIIPAPGGKASGVALLEVEVIVGVGV